MPFLKHYRPVLAVAFFICLAAHLDAPFKASPATARKPSGHETRIRRIEATTVDMSLGNNKSPLRLDLEKLMQLFNVPGLSVAVIENFQIVWAKAYGVVETGSSRPITTGTLFQAGSISKPVAAAGVLSLVEQGKLSLDEDVNRTLKRGKCPKTNLRRAKR